jgi:replicative superfamily II helicase
MLALANAIFELLYPNLKTQAVFTVPTRALAFSACVIFSQQWQAERLPCSSWRRLSIISGL